jgi:beta-lactamase regulating signal transducer with metallopeptidase domain
MRATVQYSPVPSDTATAAPKSFASTSFGVADAARRSAAAAWLAIALVLVARLLIRVRNLNRDVATFATIGDPRVLRIASDAQRFANVSRSVRLVWSERFRSPAVCGILRPTIVIPSADITAAMSDADLRLMLLHEFAHVRGRDALWSLLASVVTAMHWFNPLVWLAAKWFREDRELACDARVLRIVGNEHRHAYGECLLRVVERVSHLRPHPVAVGAFGSFQQLKRRIDMISTFDGRRSVLGRLAGTLAVLAIGFVAITCAPASTLTTADGPTAPLVKPDMSDPDVSAEMQSILDQKVDALDATEAPLGKVIAALATKSHVKIEIDPNWEEAGKGLADVVVHPPAMKNVTLAEALNSICASGPTAMAYEVAGDTIVVGSGQVGAIVTRTYDIRDLLVEIPNFDSFDSAPSTRPADTAVTREKRVEELRDLIKNTVASDTWKDNGGLIGSIQELGGQFVVTQTKVNHAYIFGLLEKIRGGRAVQITVTARLITVAVDKVPAEVNTLLTSNGDKGGSSSATFVAADQVSAILKAIQAEPGAQTITAPRLTLFSGQRAFVKVNREQSYISTFTMTRTEKGERKFEPVVAQAPAGVTLAVEATASADRKYVTLTLKPVVTRLLRMDTEPFAGDPEEKGLVVQKPVIETQTMDTTLSIPDGGTCVLRSGPNGADGKQMLLLLVTSKVVVPGGH